jgi:hypothetical protein
VQLLLQYYTMLSLYIVPIIRVYYSYKCQDLVVLLGAGFLFFLVTLLEFLMTGLLILFSRRESNHVSYGAETEAVTDAAGTGEQHHHALDTASPATGRRQTIVESLDKALVQRCRIAIFVFKRLAL